jgi:uncharacterized protein YyaL (SSP411 family)
MSANALIHEKSPYLLQHAHNPVDWFPWGEAAFRKAREEDKPIFLSVGYSTCHWCHVMERESFESETIADLLNKYFVSIKVDREERPDVDRIYMTFVQATTGSGGWPMSVFLTPDLKPFFGGTYFPPEPRFGHPGLGQVLERVAEAWRFDRAKVLESSAEIVNQLSKAVDQGQGAAAAGEAELTAGFEAFRQSFDKRHGGFGSAPKFPRPSVQNFLLRYWARTGDVEALEMVFATLNAMGHGGIHDHIGGGFHRYAVDYRWFVPHFEKMLYDQAQLAVSYLEGFQASGDEYYAGVARGILDYVLRDLTHAEGGFYSAEDADSPDPARPDQKHEGAFYLWTRAEIEDVLGKPAADWFCRHHGVQEHGNVHDDPHGEFEGRNILHETRKVEDTAREFDRSEAEMRETLESARAKLLEARSRRPRPHLDDKILTAWNGLTISALAKGAQVLDEARYLDAARRAAEFVLGRMYDSERNALLRRFRDGDAAIPGFLDDYAFFVQGLLDLYETDFDVRYLELAAGLTDAQLARFEDRERGGFYSTAAGHTELVLRMKDEYDGAEPSGNSISAMNLLRLAEMTDRDSYREAAARTLRAFASHMRVAPLAVPQMLASLAYSTARRRQIVLLGEKNAGDTREMLREVRRRFLPNQTVLLIGDERSRERLVEYLPFVAAMRRIDGAATAYVCENYTCGLPTADLKEFAGRLREAR